MFGTVQQRRDLCNYVYVLGSGLFVVFFQVAAGAVGVCSAKLHEAEALIDGGVGDVFLSNMIVRPNRHHCWIVARIIVQ